jgi:hypothetical protein
MAIKQITKEELKDILKQHFKISTIKIVTVDIGDEYNTLIDDSKRPLTINLEIT